jgi:hypothetical protein
MVGLGNEHEQSNKAGVVFGNPDVASGHGCGVVGVHWRGCSPYPSFVVLVGGESQGAQ